MPLPEFPARNHVELTEGLEHRLQISVAAHYSGIRHAIMLAADGETEELGRAGVAALEREASVDLYGMALDQLRHGRTMPPDIETGWFGRCVIPAYRRLAADQEHVLGSKDRVATHLLESRKREYLDPWDLRDRYVDIHERVVPMGEGVAQNVLPLRWALYVATGRLQVVGDRKAEAIVYELPLTEGEAA